MPGGGGEASRGAPGSDAAPDAAPEAPPDAAPDAAPEAAPDAPAFAALRALGLAALRLDYAFTERGGTADAARKLGLDEHLVVKSLVFDDGTGARALMALMHGDMRVSVRRLERLAGMRRLVPSAPATAHRLTGYLPGGICPFGLLAPLPVFAQESLFRQETLYINAGARGVIAVISPEALRRLGAVSGDFASVRP
ncbi:aminoacyl-tRNA deacylase [Desulfovibrio sp.]|uniref:aminoacyl-tRNA deacylase n=1 Tax=Desulfovibrio sp. TaxID=885 RepID=UPI0025BACF3E|nr:aminoacyl-tRNA deacylase [Desulfovibrio sp.]